MAKSNAPSKLERAWQAFVQHARSHGRIVDKGEFRKEYHRRHRDEVLHRLHGGTFSPIKPLK